MPVGERAEDVACSTMWRALRAKSGSFDLLERPVDQTDLGGGYDFTLEWTPEPARGPSAPNVGAQSDPQQGPTFQEAFHDQLGLKLESTKGPVQTPVIDRVERPSENWLGRTSESQPGTDHQAHGGAGPGVPTRLVPLFRKLRPHGERATRVGSGIEQPSRNKRDHSFFQTNYRL